MSSKLYILTSGPCKGGQNIPTGDEHRPPAPGRSGGQAAMPVNNNKKLSELERELRQEIEWLRSEVLRLSLTLENY